ACSSFASFLQEICRLVLSISDNIVALLGVTNTVMGIGEIVQMKKLQDCDIEVVYSVESCPGDLGKRTRFLR
ncbi:MAG: hypothetical protein QM218_03810, partial [Candidatus Cloacimonadota bacterium]|nr:hypothetical protein [Candidatus Cloacimonadota bacterium]